jgi:hexosaminidase
MQREHLATYAQVQGYITTRLARFLESNGRRAVAWDEVLEANVPTSVVIMAWRGGGMAEQAMRSGHDVITTPDGPLYFDAYQGDRAQEPPAMRFVSTLEQVYRYDPSQTAGATSHLLGAQANLWTEQIATSDHVFYMLLPRALALAELTWTPPPAKSWSSFNARMPSELAWLEQHGYKFRIPDVAFGTSASDVRFAAVPGRIDSAVAETRSPFVRLALQSAAPGAMHYTTDGSAPTIRSPLFRSPFGVSLAPGEAVEVRAAAFLNDGTRGAVSSCTIRRRAPHAWRRSLRTFPSWTALVSSRSADVYTPPPSAMR